MAEVFTPTDQQITDRMQGVVDAFNAVYWDARNAGLEVEIRVMYENPLNVIVRRQIPATRIPRSL